MTRRRSDDMPFLWNLPDDLLGVVLAHIPTRAELTWIPYWILRTVRLVSKQFYRVVIDRVAPSIPAIERRCLDAVIVEGTLPWFQGLVSLSVEGTLRPGRRLGHITRLTRLQCLALTHFIIESDELRKMTCLRDLALFIIDGDTSDIRRLTNLTCLSLGSTPAQIDDLIPLTALTSLHCGVKQDVSGLSRLTTLRTLDLRGCDCVTDADIRGMTNLTRLDLTSSSATNKVVDSMPQLWREEDVGDVRIVTRLYTTRQ